MDGVMQRQQEKEVINVEDANERHSRQSAALDAKKSPLALLAQTCNNIGADLLPNNRLIIPPIEKPRKNCTKSERQCNGHSLTGDERERESVSSSLSSEKNFGEEPSRSSSVDSDCSNNRKISYKPYESSVTKNYSKDCKDLTQRSNNNDLITSRLSPNTRSSKVERASPINNSSYHQRREKRSLCSSSLGTNNSTSKSYDSQKNNEHNQRNGLASSPVTSPSSMTAPTITSSVHSKSTKLASPKSDDNCSTSFSSLASGPQSSQPQQQAVIDDHYLSRTAVGAKSCCNGCQAVTSTAFTHLSTLSPYLHYQRLKSATGQAIPSLQPPVPCRDTCLCNHCPIGVPPLTSSVGALPSNNVCNWMNGTSYCGKRFSSPEELLQHLKTHTNSSSSLSSFTPPFNPFGYYGSPPPLLSSSNTSINPRSHLDQIGLFSNRYHPYKSYPLTTGPNALISPYSLASLSSPLVAPQPALSPYLYPGLGSSITGRNALP
ncbi:zinc finger protein Noc-like protein [Dinothrombium tinctorium]|uniref:Zinc finger protein Noc-like protein n=1 Tax=Dinothrombium tinctorium TaxID=1965070 RepID=A0A443RR05_9ACAR|nr:zinc finger protein Noc-like protein [Dinothrombium tinctorium]